MLGVLLALDVGRARIGIARSDALGLLATPVETVPRQLRQIAAGADLAKEIARLSEQFGGGEQSADSSQIPADLARICELVAECKAAAVIVGLPKNLQAERTASTDDAEFFAHALFCALKSSGSEALVRLVDERFSTKTAQQQLQQAGKRAKNSRIIIDQQAAVVILQQVLDSLSMGANPYLAQIGQ